MSFPNMKISIIMNLEELGKRIRTAREDQGLSQEDFANLIGKDQTAVSEYENGKRRVAAIDMPILADALKVPITYFFEGDFIPSDFDDPLLQHFHRIPDNAKEDVVELMRILAKIMNRGK